MKLSVSAYRAHASAHKKILSSGFHSQLNYGSTGAAAGSSSSTSATAVGLYAMDPNDAIVPFNNKDLGHDQCQNSDTDIISPTGTSSSGQEHSHHHHHHHHQHTGAVSKHRTPRNDDDNNSNAHSSDNSKSPSHRKSRIGDGASDPDSDWTRSNQRWMKLRTTVQISSAIQKKPPLKREDSFLKRFSTRQIPETQETVEDTGSESASGDVDKIVKSRRRRYLQKRRSVVNPDENFYFYWLMMLTICVLYNFWALIVRQSFPELQKAVPTFWFICDMFTDLIFICDIIVQLRTGYLEQGLMVYDDKKLACHYMHSRDFIFDVIAMVPLDLIQLHMGTQPLLRFPRFFKAYRSVKFYYIVESRTVWPNLWRVVNLIHILLILAHWFGCFYYLLSEAEGFQGDWVYPYRPGDYATLTRKYLGSLYWSTLTLTTIGDLPTPETNAEYVFTIVSYLIGVFIFATIVGQVGNVITNRNANRLEFERLLDGAKTYMRHHKVPGGMKRRVLRWYDYSWSRGRIQGGGDINTALGLLPDKLKTELALHVNLSVLKKVTIFQECQPEFLHDLVLKMKAYIFTPGDSICRKGEVAREMFIIADGILEVLSETGKVLTTMKAGDFFGEIGILNLDGLNKRTADVRSVGYSELFSLSREDVLAAMKDYPEAQDILQTLGRKRLMEVRCVNKKYAKAQSDKEAAAFKAHHHNAVHQSDSSENSASKKIVDKLRNDVKGFRSVLKKTRTSRRSDESLEMQPLHNISPKGSKSMLKRMSRVRSEDKEETAEEREELHDKAPSPIGAGLPLLQRLRLLKEKQDREEREVKSTTTITTTTTTTPLLPPPQKSPPPHSHVTCTLSPQESIQEEPERELNEGLPLIQRLQQLRIKNNNDAISKDAIKAVVISPATVSISNKIDTISFVNSSSISNISNNNSNYHSSVTPMPSLGVTQVKPTMKVSFKDRIRKLQQSGSLSRKEPPKSLPVISTRHEIDEASFISGSSIHAITSPSASSTRTKPIRTVSNKIVKPSIKTSSAPTSEADTPIKPWSKLKLATLISSSYTSLTNCTPDTDIDIDTGTPIKNFSLGNIPQQLKFAEAKTSSRSSLPRGSLRSHKTQKRSATPSASGSSTVMTKELLATIEPAAQPSTKLYQSVFDLSPEYNGLPFVKRLKILNERQKLAELEKALQTRSFSLDSSKTHISVPITESLYRCYSDTSGIYSQFMSTYESSSTTSTNTSTTSENSRKHAQHEFLQHEYHPLSPTESNETAERRKLKSILKKLHKNSRDNESSEIATPTPTPTATTTPTPTGPSNDTSQLRSEEGLCMAPTLEGPPSSAKTLAYEENFGVFGTNIEDGFGGSGSSSVEHIATAAAATSATTMFFAPTPSTMTPGAVRKVATPLNSPMDQVIGGGASLGGETYEYSPSDAISTQMVTNNNQKIMSSPIPSSTAAAASAVTATENLHRPNVVECIEFPTVEHVTRPAAEYPVVAQEYFNEILCGINDVIKTHISEMHLKFQTQFSSLACEVKRRDAIIAHLQMKLKDIELKGSPGGGAAAGMGSWSNSGISPRRKMNQAERRELIQMLDAGELAGAGRENSNRSNSGESSSGSSAELLFMRGDSLDTVFTSSPPIPSERCSSSPSTSARYTQDAATAAMKYKTSYPRMNSHSGISYSSSSRGPWNERGVVVSDITGNLTRLPDSVILDIGESSSSSSESELRSKQHVSLDIGEEEEDLEEGYEEELQQELGEVDDHEEKTDNAAITGDNNDDDDDDDDDQAVERRIEDAALRNVRHNDWELRMLAAEMEKQERKRGHSLCGNLSDLKRCGTILRRRRKFSDTEAEYSETDAAVSMMSIRDEGSSASTSQQQQRPRASSLDQFNLRYGSSSSSGRSGSDGIFKAMSIDRDKDKL